MAPVSDSGWSLMVSQSYDQILAQLKQPLGLLMAVGALLALVCMLIVRRLARRISRPMEQLAESTTRSVSYTHLGVYKRQAWARC